MPVRTVSFTSMSEGTKEDYAILAETEEEFAKTLADRILAAVRALEHSFAGYQVSRLEHSLQSASRAHRDGRDEEYVVAALVHDIGDELAPHSHGEMTAAVMRPYLAERLCWIVQHHPVFQEYYYAHHYGGDRNARERYRGHQWFDDCAEFCELYDQNCFDPAYDSLPLEFFAPMVRNVFSEPRYLENLR
ncbi:MAG TPA: HD domain-containing protein [Solirubrobacteraceae bacterium]|nr:HD domain-containing protein [Solirubrobacteraceae bacterium]